MSGIMTERGSWLQKSGAAVVPRDEVLGVIVRACHYRFTDHLGLHRKEDASQCREPEACHFDLLRGAA